MARIVRFTEPPAVSIRDGWEVIASSGGTYADGTRGDVQLYNGTLQAADMVSLSVAHARDAFAAKVAELSQLPQGEVAQALLRLKDAVEIALRQHDEAAKSPGREKPDPTAIFTDVDPWDDPVDGAALIATLEGVISRFVALPKGASYAVALWVLHTYLLDAISVTPVLLLTSPEPRCGKTTLMGLLQELAWRPLAASNISTAAVYRSIAKWQPTMLIDEADSFMRQNDELRGVINSGHTRATAYVVRCNADTNDPERFSTWAAKAIAGIGRQAPTIMDRSIEIAMRRRLPDESVERFRGDRSGQFLELAQQCLRWTIDNADAVRDADPDMPASLHDRAADNWRPLLQIAEVAGGPCPNKAREALHALVGDRPEEDETAGIMALRDLQNCFEESATGRVLSDDLVTFLHEIEDRPWTEWGRAQRPITKLQVSRLLKPFGIRPTTVRDGHKRGKGYRIEDSQDAFFRYIPPPRNVTPGQSSNGAGFRDFQGVTQENDVTDEKSIIPSDDAGCHGVTDGNGSAEEKIDSDREIFEF